MTTSPSDRTHWYVLSPDRYDIASATSAACACGTPGCELFPTGGDGGPWMRPNPRVSVAELRWRAHRLDRAHHRFRRRSEKTPKQGLIGVLHVGGGKDWGGYRGTWSSLAGLAEHTKSERLLVDEELRRRHARAVPPGAGRWWHEFVPTTEVVLWSALGALTGTAFAAVVVGIMYVCSGLAQGNWGFQEVYLKVWGGLVGLGVVAALRNVIDDD